MSLEQQGTFEENCKQDETYRRELRLAILAALTSWRRPVSFRALADFVKGWFRGSPRSPADALIRSELRTLLEAPAVSEDQHLHYVIR